jgi:hypothetical protein
MVGGQIEKGRMRTRPVDSREETSVPLRFWSRFCLLFVFWCRISAACAYDEITEVVFLIPQWPHFPVTYLQRQQPHFCSHSPTLCSSWQYRRSWRQPFCRRAQWRSWGPWIFQERDASGTAFRLNGHSLSFALWYLDNQGERRRAARHIQAGGLVFLRPLRRSVLRHKRPAAGGPRQQQHPARSLRGFRDLRHRRPDDLAAVRHHGSGDWGISAGDGIARQL